MGQIAQAVREWETEIGPWQPGHGDKTSHISTVADTWPTGFSAFLSY